MNNSLITKFSTFFLSLLFMLIIVSFLFGDYKNFSSASPQDVASVDGISITQREYQMRLAQQVEFFSQMMGGQMTQQQMAQMGIKDTVLGGLVQQKLLLNAGMKMGLTLSEAELKEEIKKLPYFQTSGKFDVNKYRGLLQANNYTPTQFEEMIGHDMTTRKMDQMLNTMIVSDKLAKDILTFKTNIVKTDSVRVERQDLVSQVSVTSSEAKEFAADEKNARLLEDMYKENFAKYNKEEEVKARHILFRAEKPEDEKAALAKAEKARSQLTAKNFTEKAKQLTEDDSGKSNGGDLGWFTKERMVPEFSKAAFEGKIGDVVGPIKTNFGYHYLLIEGKKGAQKQTLDQVKVELATSALQKRKVQELDQLMNSTKAKLEDMLAKGDSKGIEALKKSLKLTYLPNTEVNQYDLSVGPNSLTPTEGTRLFTTTPGTVIDLSTPGALFLVKVGQKVNADAQAKVAEQLKTETQVQSQQLSKKFREELLKELNAKAKVVTNPALM